MCEHKKRKGLDLSDASAHEKDHQVWSRRSFLKTSSLMAGASFFLSQLPIASAYARNKMSSKGSNKIIVLIELEGGNDGLNTLIPLYDFDHYKSKRKRLHIPKHQTVGLTKEYGLHPALKPLKSLWDKGMMKVINGVGYPESSLSHFRSKDVWSTSSSANEFLDSGWLGRYFETVDNPKGIPKAMEIAEEGSQLFEGKAMPQSLNVKAPTELFDATEDAFRFDLSNEDSLYGKELDFIRSVTNSAIDYSKSIKQAYLKGKNQGKYFRNDITHHLRQVAKYIKGGLGTRVYRVSHGDFDTHSEQSWKHRTLLQELAQAIHAFYEDLSKMNLQDEVVVMTYSEFGRRLEENGSEGTDHGTAAPMMLFGTALGGSAIIGDPMNLRDLDANGNVKYDIDFRTVYSTVLQHGLGANAALSHQVLKGNFQPLNGIF